VALGCLATCALGIGAVRPRLADAFHKLKATSDVYALPSPDHAIVASLGWRSALADVIFANMLVSYGLHFQEKRRFEFAGNYLDTIVALDPKFRQPYMFSDTLLTVQPVVPRKEDYVKARDLLERGMQAFPTDGELWTAAGQFLAYLAPPRLGDKKLEEEWRMEGARRLARACELLGSNEALPYHCITAAGLFSSAGNREAVVQFLERVLAVSDNDEIRELALGYLERVVGEREREQAERRFQRFNEAWSKDLPFVSKNTLLVIGPRFDSARCSGIAAREDAGCASSWQAWAQPADRREP
jgi:tetratricopeptide (TPR) repeat protein